MSLHANFAVALVKSDDWYGDCVYWVNAVRAKEGLPALKRWAEKEECTDEMSAYDQTNGAHAAFKTKGEVGCTNILAQNSCPGYSDNKEDMERCFLAMWLEKETPGATTSSLTDPDDKSTGHYRNLRGGMNYNEYDRVACGFYVENGEQYININFGKSESGNDFECGGDKSTKPSTWLVDDCSVRGDYSGCTSTCKNYDIPACEWTDKCYYNSQSDACEDKTDAWWYANLPDFADTTKCSLYPYNTDCYSKGAYNFCAKSCGTCKCDNVPSDALASCDVPSDPQPQSSAASFCVKEFIKATDCQAVGDWKIGGQHNGRNYYIKVEDQRQHDDRFFGIWWQNNPAYPSWEYGEWDDSFSALAAFCDDPNAETDPWNCPMWMDLMFTPLSTTISSGACKCEDDGLNGHCPSDASGCIGEPPVSNNWMYKSKCRQTCNTCHTDAASHEITSKSSSTAQSLFADVEVYEKYALNGFAVVGAASLMIFAWKRCTRKQEYTDLQSQSEI